jgi:multiple sugar transport system substrate-binding protein
MAKKMGWCLALFLLLVAAIIPAFAAPVTIQYAFWGNPTSIGVEKDIIDEFEKTHPNIKVNPIAIAYGDYHQKLLTLLAGGQAPDVMRIDSYFFADFMHSRALMDLTGLIERDKIKMSAYYQNGLPDSMYKGHYYGLPWGTAPLFMIVNNKMYKDAGLEMPSFDWTWDEFLKDCKALSKGEGANRQYGFGSGFGSASGDFWSLLPFVWINGGDLFDKSRTKFSLDQSASTKQIQLIAELIKQGLFVEPSQMTSVEVLNRWQVNNKIAIRFGSAAELLTLQQFEDFAFSIYPFPGKGKYTNATIVKSNTIGLSPSSKNVEAAWEFLKFLRAPGQPGETLYMKAKRVPPSVDDPELWKLYADPNKYPKNIAESVKTISGAKYSHPLPLRSGWLEVQGALVPELQKVFSGQITAQAAMKGIAPKIKEILSRTAN